MNRFAHFSMVGLIVVVTSGARMSRADEVAQESRAIREIFVPFEDLSVLLEHEPRRVLLSRQEYEDLLSLARVAPESHAPRPAAIISAEYAIEVALGQASISGTLVVDVLEDGLQAVGLSLGGVGLRRAILDGQGAPIGQADDGRFLLFVEGRGQHRLQLDMVAPLETAAARQVLNFMIPTPAATKLHLTVPGDVEVRSGAATITRVVDTDAGVTRFDLLPRRGHNSLPERGSPYRPSAPQALGIEGLGFVGVDSYRGNRSGRSAITYASSWSKPRPGPRRSWGEPPVCQNRP